MMHESQLITTELKEGVCFIWWIWFEFMHVVFCKGQENCVYIFTCKCLFCLKRGSVFYLKVLIGVYVCDL